MVENVIGLHVKHPLFMSDFYKNWIFSTDFLKILRFHENPSRRSQVVLCRQQDRQTDGQDKASSHFSQFHKQIMKEHRG